MTKVKRSGWKVLILAALAFLTAQAGWFGLEPLRERSRNWAIIAGAGMVLLLAFLILVYLLLFHRGQKRLADWIARLPAWIKIPITLLLLAAPALVAVSPRWGDMLSSPWLRAEMYLTVSAILWLMFFSPREGWHSIAGLILCASLAAYSMAVAAWLATVSANPFSLSWSEGNRFYDYSISFAKNLYNYPGHLSVPYDSPGRYALWGSLFLIPGLPIWAHRLWNALLWLGTPLLLSALLFRPVKNRTLRFSATLWGALFIMQGPVYPHLLVPMILLAIVIHRKNFWVRLIAGAVISFYAGSSRFTWAVLPGIWLVIADLVEYYPLRAGSWWKRLLPTAALGLAGILPGMDLSWFKIASGTSLVSEQPLLWNRLLPNPTNPLGILPGSLLAMLPLMGLILWAMLRAWRVNKLAVLAMAAALAGTMVIGYTASVKIGGGSNLHNLDMALLTLLFIASLGLQQVSTRETAENEPAAAPSGWAAVLVMLALLLPGWASYRNARPAQNFKPADIAEAMTEVKQAVAQANTPDGQILFLDQRQLLTFGNIQGIELIPEYEKKYMMDNAMGNNAAYFSGFYNDLRDHRFALIISDVQKPIMQDASEGFSEENNAYVRWVSIPLLEYYRPIYTNNRINLMLLVPTD